MNREQIAWGRLLQPTPRGRYEHVRSWEKHDNQRTNFRAKVSRQPSGCWLWTAQSPVRSGKPYPLWGVKQNGRCLQRSAFTWMIGEFFPELAATLPHRTTTSCGESTCISPVHRLNGMVTRGVLTPEQAREVYALKGTNARGVAVSFGISANQVMSIWRGRNWADVTGAKYRVTQRKVTPPEVVEAIRQRRGQASSPVVGEEFGVSSKTVLRIWNNKHRGLLLGQDA